MNSALQIFQRNPLKKNKQTLITVLPNSRTIPKLMRRTIQEKVQAVQEVEMKKKEKKKWKKVMRPSLHPPNQV
jgi:hypothetical protein